MTSTSASGGQDRRAGSAGGNGGLAAKSREIGARNEAAVLEALRVAGDAGLSPAELASRVQLANKTRRDTVVRLITTGRARRAGERGRIYAVTDDQVQTASTEDAQTARAVDTAEQRWMFDAKREWTAGLRRVPGSSCYVW